MSDSVREATVPVQPPYRLDLTATALRRLSTNVVDVFDGRTYRRIVEDAGELVSIAVTQRSATELLVRAHGAMQIDPATLVRRMLGTDVDLTLFYAGAASIPWLAVLVDAARGVRPPRYPSLWESIVNAVVYQQVSIHAAGAILGRVIIRFAGLRTLEGITLSPFPQPASIADANPLELRALGLSANKVVALRTLARAVLDGELSEAQLDPLATAQLVERLQTWKGIGPWTAAVIALRGFGRLDVFPLKDSGVARALKQLAGDPVVDATTVLTALGAQRGMLYYHLLLGRLAARGEIDFAVGSRRMGSE